jgi:hypothetical protein
MMMAYDSTPTPPALSDETASAVRLALRRFVQEGTRTEELTRALRQMADEAKQKELRAEQLLIVLKGLWGSLPEVRHASSAGPYDRMLQQLITICIDQYYGK